MELIDASSCIMRLAVALWPSIVSAASVAICTAMLAMRKQKILISSVIAFSVAAALLWRGAATQWRLGLLESESPKVNETAYTSLQQYLSSEKVWQIIQSRTEHPNIRFALAMMLCERGESSFLTSKTIPALQRPAFFGEGHLAKAAKKFEFPLEVAEIAAR